MKRIRRKIGWRADTAQEILLLRVTMLVVFPSGWASPRIIQAYNEENIVAVRLARYLHSRFAKRARERGSVLSLATRPIIFLAFSASRNISPALELLLSRECYAFSRSIDGVLHLAFTFMMYVKHLSSRYTTIKKKKRLIWNSR